jgi:hypothetical protein
MLKWPRLFLIAAQFLTRWPMPRNLETDEKELGQAAMFFPPGRRARGRRRRASPRRLIEIPAAFDLRVAESDGKNRIVKPLSHGDQPTTTRVPLIPTASKASSMAPILTLFLGAGRSMNRLRALSTTARRLSLNCEVRDSRCVFAR